MFLDVPGVQEDPLFMQQDFLSQPHTVREGEESGVLLISCLIPSFYYIYVSQ